MWDAYTIHNGDTTNSLKFVSILSAQEVNNDEINEQHLNMRERFEFSWNRLNVGAFSQHTPVAVYTVRMKLLLVHRVKIDGLQLNVGLAYRYDDLRKWSMYEENGELKVGNQFRNF